MHFADEAAYKAYDARADHSAFGEGRWIPDVVEVMEPDTTALEGRVTLML